MLPTLVLLAFTEIPPKEMADRAEARLALLDHLVLSVESSTHFCDVGVDALDPTNWRPVEAPHEHVIKIVRPYLHHAWLTDARDRGYEPVNIFVGEGRFVMEHVRAMPSGRKLYTVCNEGTQAGVYRWLPILQFFDLEIQDSGHEGLNLTRLLREYPVQCVDDGDSVSHYSVTLDDGVRTTEYRFRMDDQGTPLSLIQTLYVPDNKPIRRAQYTVATELWNGYPLVSEAIVTVFNPNVAEDYLNVHKLVVLDVRVDESLTREAVAIDPPYANCTVEEVFGPDVVTHTVYDANGDVVDVLEGGNTILADAANPRGWRWRMVVPPIAIALGICAATALNIQARKRKAAWSNRSMPSA